MAHTPGPWEIHHYGDNEGDIHGSDGALVCMMREGDTDPGENWSADARLIAAAPEMIRALRAVRDDIAALANDINGWRAWDATAVDQLLGHRLVRLNGALRRAEGRE